MQDLADRDYFTDHSILLDPYAYFEALRAKGPIYRLPGRDIFVVTGFEESLEVLNNNADFSSSVSTGGAAAPLPFTPEGDDLTGQIEAHREQFLGGELLVARDDRPHSNSRALLSRLFTPSRLKANEEYMTSLAGKLVSDAVAKGRCDLIKDIAVPFATLVIADLLGVPPNDRDHFMEVIAAGVPPGSLDEEERSDQNQPLVVMAGFFVNYLMERKQAPRDDVLTELASASFPDGTTPDIAELVRLSTFLFGAGQDTTAKLLGNAMRFIIEQPGLQDQLRSDTSLLPAFIEEVLRLEGSTKMTSRLVRKSTKVGGMDIPVGTKVMVALAAANRDPRRYENPRDFVIGRPKIKEHLAFGRGAHVCIGAPLARVEIRIVLEKFLQKTSNIDLDETVHGPRGARKLAYEPSFIIRGLEELQLKLTPRQ
ncbi:MAG TPA: cytochrome P450 [Acidocella sp.]|jgi:cytochrome P450|nr:cytochrome P450 [Acidocella sp.]